MKKEEMAARDQEIVEKIHRTSLKILEEIGMAFHSERALEQLRQGGIRVEGNRAYFTEKQVMDAMDAAVKDFTVYARNPKYNVRMNTEDLYMTPGYGSPSVCEADGTVRPATFEDFLKLAEIVQQSEEFFINGGILAQPSDIDAEISAEGITYGFGSYCCTPDFMKNVRAAMAAHPARMERMIRAFEKDGSYRLDGTPYKRPKGHVSDRIDPWYNLKNIGFSAFEEWNDDNMGPGLPAYLVRRFGVLLPLYRWLWTCVPPEEPEETYRRR